MRKMISMLDGLIREYSAVWVAEPLNLCTFILAACYKAYCEIKLEFNGFDLSCNCLLSIENRIDVE